MDHMLKRLVGEKIVLTTSADEDLGLVQVDPGHLQQVIVNLVVNARDAMPNGGTVTIALKNADVSAAFSHQHISLLEGKYVLLEVKDTGIGITPETMAHLFEPFFTTKEKGRGTGLGLSTSYGIVKQNHGEILVRSAPGAGSTFSIYLPRTTAEKADPQEPTRSAAPPYRGGSETVLVAEDEDGVRTVITDMLRKQGYSVMTARGGAEALEVARTLPKVDLLISDVIMPGMNGPELARKLRAMRPDVRVLYVSGYPDRAIEQKSILDPATSFLSKPFTPEDLAIKVRAVLDRALEPARPSAGRTRRAPRMLRDEQSFDKMG
jgi:CheY-like chemotaxis protein